MLIAAGIIAAVPAFYFGVIIPAAGPAEALLIATATVFFLKNRCNAVRCGAHARRISLADNLCYFDVDGMDRDDGRRRKLDSPYAAASRLVQAEHAMRHVGQLSVATRIIRYSKA